MHISLNSHFNTFLECLQLTMIIFGLIFNVNLTKKFLFASHATQLVFPQLAHDFECKRLKGLILVDNTDIINTNINTNDRFYHT